MSYQLFDEGSGLVFRFSGDITYQEITVANHEGWEHPGWEKHQYQIWDFLNAKSLASNELEAKMTASMDKAHTRVTQSRLSRPMKVAFVSDNEHFIKLMEAYVAESESENMEARIFADEANAREWVGA